MFVTSCEEGLSVIVHYMCVRFSTMLIHVRLLTTKALAACQSSKKKSPQCTAATAKAAVVLHLWEHQAGKPGN